MPAPRRAAAWRRLPSWAWAVALLAPLLAAGFVAYHAYREGAGDAARFASSAVPAPSPRDVLVAELARNPRDCRAWVLLARMESAADRPAEAAAAYEKAVAASPKVAADPAVWCEYADALALTQGGRLAGRPRELVQRALALNAAHPKALEMAGGVAFEAQDYAAAAKYWRDLLAQMPAGTRAYGELEAAIARADERAGNR